MWKISTGTSAGSLSSSRRISAGVYFVRLQVGQHMMVQKFALIK